MKKGRGAELFRQLTALNSAPANSLQQKRMQTFCDTIYHGRKMTDKIFSEFVDYLKTDKANRPFVLSHKISGIKKAGKFIQIKGMLGTLAVEKPQDGRLSSIVTPVYETDFLSGSQFLSQKRRSCVGFASDHVEFRYKTKTKENFDYQGQELQESVTMAMMIGNVIAEVHLGPQSEYTPVFIPHKEGAFLGYAGKSSQGDSFRRITQYNEKGVNKGHKDTNKLETLPYDLMMRPDWDPECFSRLLTFIPNSELSSSQAKLRQDILDTFDRHSTTVTQLWDRFIDIMSESEPELDGIKALEMAIVDIVTGHNWRKEIKHGQKHLPNSKWTPDDRAPY